MKKLMHFILAMLLLMLLQGCQTTKIKYVTYIPTLDFPAFPVTDEIVDNPDDTCSVPDEWIIRLQEYHIYITETEKTYKEIKNSIQNKN